MSKNLWNFILREDILYFLIHKNVSYLPFQNIRVYQKYFLFFRTLQQSLFHLHM